MKFNTKLKIYDDNTYSVTYCSHKIFNPETKKTKKKTVNNHSVIKKIKKETKPENVLRSQKRAKERIFDIVYLNDWDYFVTLTFNPKLVNSYNSCDIMCKVCDWFTYQRKKYNMSYILIPELHKSKRIHIHALVLNGNLRLVDSGHKNSYGDIRYNILSWRLGWSVAEKVYGNRMQIAHYVTKYISKDIVKLFGKYYWSSRDLVRDVYTEYCNSDFSSIDSEAYSVPNTNILLKYENHLHYDTKK